MKDGPYAYLGYFDLGHGALDVRLGHETETARNGRPYKRLAVRLEGGAKAHAETHAVFPRGGAIEARLQLPIGGARVLATVTMRIGRAMAAVPGTGRLTVTGIEGEAPGGLRVGSAFSLADVAPAQDAAA